MEIDLYLQIMEEIKKRADSIIDILNKKRTTSFHATNIEFMCLQIRKILELISLGSLVANHKEFEEQKVKYHKFWHAERILNDIEQLNPNFFPRPIIEKYSDDPKVAKQIVDKTDGFLTRKEFSKVYEKCGKIMHADNPFGSKVDYRYYEKQINEWLTKIMHLLSSHIIKLKDDQNFYLIHMDEKRDDKVHGYTFSKIK